MTDFVNQYFPEMLRAYVTLPEQGLTGQRIKQFCRMGDRIAVSAFLHLEESVLYSPETCRRLSKAISIAFDVGCGQGESPDFSIFLIKRMLTRVSDGGVRPELEKTLRLLNLHAEKFVTDPESPR